MALLTNLAIKPLPKSKHMVELPLSEVEEDLEEEEEPQEAAEKSKAEGPLRVD